MIIRVLVVLLEYWAVIIRVLVEVLLEYWALNVSVSSITKALGSDY